MANKCKVPFFEVPEYRTEHLNKMISVPKVKTGHPLFFNILSYKEQKRYTNVVLDTLSKFMNTKLDAPENINEILVLLKCKFIRKSERVRF